MKYTKTVLPNGLRLVIVPMKDSQTATVMTLVEAGSFYENQKNNGISHFLEHMCFKGTKTRTGDDIKLELDLLGSSNAFTGFEYTGYYIKSHAQHVDRAIDIVADIYQNSTFPEKDIATEKGVIVEEINMYNDMPQAIVWKIWQQILFGDQPASFDIAGTPANVKSFTQKDFIKYHHDHYVAEKTVVVVAGNVDAKKIKKQIQSAFALIPDRKSNDAKKIKVTQKSPAIKIQTKKSDQAHLILGFRAFNTYDDRNYPLALATTVLGKGFSSRLFKILRDDHGLCYYVHAGNSSHRTHGELTISAGLNVSQIEKATELIIKECKKIRDEGITKEELQKAKDIMLNKKALNLETSDQYADFYGFQEIFKEEILNPTQVNQKIKAVTLDDIQKVLKTVIKNKGLNFALVGPYKSNPKIKKILDVE